MVIAGGVLLMAGAGLVGATALRRRRPWELNRRGGCER
ncbi:hypothetical protein [Kocuria palustris]